MSARTIRTVGDLFLLFNNYEDLKGEVNKAYLEYENCNYDPCGYLRGNLLDAEEVLEAFLTEEIIFGG